MGPLVSHPPATSVCHPAAAALSRVAGDPPLNANTLAKALSILANRIAAILKGQRGITGDTALRLGTFFNTSPGYWMNLQKTYELQLAGKALPSKIKKHIQESRESLASV